MLRAVDKVQMSEGLKMLGEHKKTMLKIVGDYIKSQWPRYLQWLPPFLLLHYVPISLYIDEKALEWTSPFSSVSVRVRRTDEGDWNWIQINDDWYGSTGVSLRKLKSRLEEALPIMRFEVKRWGHNV